MKKFYAFAAAALAALSVNAQLYIVGSGEGLEWNPGAPLVVNAGADGNYTVEIKNLEGFKLSSAAGTGADDWATYNAGCKTCKITAENMGKVITLEAGDADINVWKGDWKLVVDKDFTTLIATTDTPAPTGPSDIYLRGTFTGSDWPAVDTYKFTAAESDEEGIDYVYTFVCEGETVLPAEASFKIAGPNWGDIQYGLGDVVVFNEEKEWPYQSFEGNSSLDKDFEGTITATFPMGFGSGTVALVTFEEKAGINDVTIDANAPVEYFNLQGVRVANPENGLFIARQGNKVVKVVK